jgi:hypothetical protein
MNILCRLPWRKPRQAVPRASPPAAGAPGASDDQACPLGCGWFDSSHELQQGLLVREHDSAETLAGELPLANWLELHLSGRLAASRPDLG